MAIDESEKGSGEEIESTNAEKNIQNNRTNNEDIFIKDELTKFEEGEYNEKDIISSNSEDFYEQKFADFLKDNNYKESNYTEHKTKFLKKFKEQLVGAKFKFDHNKKDVEKKLEKEFKILKGTKIPKKIEELSNKKNFNFDNSLDSKRKLKSDSFLSPKKILNLKLYETERKSFISKIYKKADYEQKQNNNDDDIIKDLDKDRKENLTEDQIEANNFFYKRYELNTNETIELLKSYNSRGKIKILKYLNAPIKLDFILKSNLFKEKDIDSLLLKDIKETYPKLSESDIDISIFKKADISFSVDKIENLLGKSSKSFLTNLMKDDKFLFEIEERLNEQEKKKIEYEAEGDYLELINQKKIQLNADGEIHENYKNLIKGQVNKETISEDIKNNIDKFEPGNYINIKLNGEEVYYFIEEVDLGDSIAGKRFKVKNLTAPFGKNLIKPEHAESEVLNYEKLFNLFKASGSKNDYIKNSSIEFIDKEDFKEKEKNGDVKLNDGIDNISSEEDLKNKLVENGNLDPSLENIPLMDLCFLDDITDSNHSYYRNFQGVGGDKLVFELQNQEMSFSDFFAEIQRHKDKYKFEKRIFSTTEITEKEPLKDIALHKDFKKLVLKEDKDNSDANKIDYFVSKGGKGAIHIEEVSGNDIKYSIGTIEHISSNKGKDEKRKFTKKRTYNGLNQLIAHLGDEEIGYKPDTEGKAIEKKDDVDNGDLDKNGGFFGKIMKNASITELLQGGKMIIDTIEQNFEHGNKLKASKLAEKMGFILPGSIRTSLKSKAEKETTELVKEKVEMWKIMGSGPATDDIKKNILFNKNAEDHEILAAMTYMVEKNGCLYAKKIGEYQSSTAQGYSSFLWFRKLGGTKAEYEALKKKIENSDETKSVSGRKDPNVFVEEKLVTDYMSKLIKRGRFGSKVNKDFWGSVETGTAKRMEKGADDVSSFHTAADKVEYTLNYLSKGEGARGLGSMEKTLGKDSDRHSMNTIPFVLGMSGITLGWNSILMQKLHSLDGTTAYPTLEMLKSEEGVKLYQDSIYAYLKKSGRNDLLKKLKKIKTQSISRQVFNPNRNNEKSKGPYGDLLEFFTENAEILTDFITLKDGFAITKREEEPILGKFYDRITGKFKDDEYTINDDSLLAGTYAESALADSGTSFAEKIVIGSYNLAIEGRLSMRMLTVYLSRLESIKKLPGIDEDKIFGISEEDRKKMWLKVFLPLEERISKIARQVYQKHLSAGTLRTYNTLEIPKKMAENKLLLSTNEDDDNDINNDKRTNFGNKAYDFFMGKSSLDEGKITGVYKDTIIDNILGNKGNSEKI